MPSPRILRLLVVCPSWVGDVVMATPALRLLRSGLPGAFIGGLVRPGLDELLAGSGLFDELHADRAVGVMGPKHVAGRVRPRRYDTAVLLSNSFSAALITRLAFIPRRIGYDRDGRGLLLTDRLSPERRGVLGARGFKPVSAVDYYLRAARATLGAEEVGGPPRLELGATIEQERAGAEVLARAGVETGKAYAILNPGGNNPAKRWPAERFVELGRHLAHTRGWIVLVNGSPGERELCASIAAGIGASGASLVDAGVTLGALKPIVRGARLMLTNDTGPRHVAAAMGTPVVTLFGPTDPRWTTLPEGAGPVIELVAAPELPADQVADEHPETCRIDRIQVDSVVEAVERALASVGPQGSVIPTP